MTWFWAGGFIVLAIVTAVAVAARYGRDALSSFVDLWAAYLWQEVGDIEQGDEKNGRG